MATDCSVSCTCKPHRTPPTSTYRPAFEIRQRDVTRDELAAATFDDITDLDDIHDARDVLRWIAARDLDIVREAMNEELS